MFNETDRWGVQFRKFTHQQMAGMSFGDRLSAYSHNCEHDLHGNVDIHMTPWSWDKLSEHARRLHDTHDTQGVSEQQDSPKNLQNNS